MTKKINDDDLLLAFLATQDERERDKQLFSDKNSSLNDFTTIFILVLLVTCCLLSLFGN